MKNWTHFRYGSWLDARVLILLFSFIRLRFFRRFQRKNGLFIFKYIYIYLYYQKIHTKTQIYINHIDIHIHMYFSTYSYLYLHIYAAHTYNSYILLNQQKKHQFFWGTFGLTDLGGGFNRQIGSSNPKSSGWKLPKIFETPHTNSWKIAKDLKGVFACFFWWIWNMKSLKPPPSDSCLLKAGVQSSTETQRSKKKVLWTQRYRSELLEVDRSGEKRLMLPYRTFKQKLPSSIN